MRILIFTLRFPYPPYRGDKLKIYNIAKNLAATNDVTILTFFDKSEEKYVREFEKMNIKIVAVQYSILEAVFHLLKALFSPTPFQVSLYQSTRLKKELARILGENTFEIVYFHLVRSLYYRDVLSKYCAIKIVDFTDSISLYLSRIIEITRNPVKKIILKMEYRRVKEYEKHAGEFDSLFLCSDTDKAYLLNNHPQLNIQILPNGIDCDYFKYESIEPRGKSILFTGNIPYFANSDAIKFFANEVFPLVVKKEPNAKFTIVGQHPTAGVKKLVSDSIAVKGFVKDIRKEYLESTVNIAPVRFGAGTLNKVLESIALGVPVVATSIAVAGMPEELKKYVFVADSPEEFADKIIYIFNNPSVRDTLMREGAKKIESLLDWKIVTSEFEAYLKSLSRS